MSTRQASTSVVIEILSTQFSPYVLAPIKENQKAVHVSLYAVGVFYHNRGRWAIYPEVERAWPDPAGPDPEPGDDGNAGAGMRADTLFLANAGCQVRCTEEGQHSFRLGDPGPALQDPG